ncbi:histidine kinase [Actinoplanes sp. NPDC089786]|uniref:sensor histidine kinase n=1 Tax=Actinoplanes sp. NPDC089786 TaxID=3155185 RepID=UPI0034406F89
MRGYAVPAAAATVVGAGLVHQWTGGGLVPTLSQLALPASMALSYSSLGALILAHRPGHRVGRLMTTIGALATLAVLAVSWPSLGVAAWVAQWAWWPPIGLIPLLLLAFPTGGLRRGPAIALTVTAFLPAVALALAALPGGRPLLAGAALTGPALIMLRVAWLGIAATAIGMIVVLGALVARFRRAALPVRRQLLCAGAAGVTVLLGELLDTAGVPVAWVAEGVALPLALTVAILRLGLWDLDVHVNRALVWLVMSAGVTAAYILIVGVVLGQGISLPVLALTALVATGFEPVRRLLQRAVDRLLYGHRDDPYAVLSRLGRHLEEVVAPAAALPRLVAAITDELRVPYAAVRITGHASALVEHGRPAVPPISFPLITHRQEVGALLVSPRQTGGGFTRSERRLLRALARQAAVAVDAHRLTLDLQRSRERIVLAREEERRRLRTDLHDGLGPGLAGIAMQVRAARRHADPTGQDLLDRLVSDLSSCSAELRHLVDALHPPALDGGLPDALRLAASRLSSGPLTVTVDCPASLGLLPAAVEVSALRIVAEAITNAVKHSGGTTCSVVVRRHPPVDNSAELSGPGATFLPTHKGGGGGGGGELELIIVDDGVGLRQCDAQRDEARRGDAYGCSGQSAGGVGLGSMRERAEELNGTCEIGPASPRGTRVVARLPIARDPASTARGPRSTARDPGPNARDRGFVARDSAYEEGKSDAESQLAGRGAVVERPVPARLP